MKILYIALITLLLSACSGMKPYPDLRNKNFTIQAITDAGSLLKDIKATLEIQNVKADCSTGYIGTVTLDKPLVQIGIPTKYRSYLTFEFDTSGFFAANEGKMSYETLFKPKPGYRYLAKVSYINEYYDVRIFEMNPGGKQSNELKLRDLDTCVRQ
jgi:hypothetical protein